MKSDDIEKDSKNPEGKIYDFIGRGSVALKGGLYVVATPIGNLRDMSFRAIETLRAADIVFCEDTRVTRKLLNAYQIKVKTQSYNDHSDDARRAEIIERVGAGEVVALVSDAGMPLISDPGYKLVRDCADAGHYVTTIPGASAPLAALQLSGLPSDQFCFLGFLPSKTSPRKKMLQAWSAVPATLIAFETGPRLIASLKDVQVVLGLREVAVVREITKLYEEARKDTPDALVAYYEENGVPRGEIVLVVAPPVDQAIDNEDVFHSIRNALKSMKTKDAAAFVAEKYGLKKSEMYALALEISKEE